MIRLFLCYVFLTAAVAKAFKRPGNRRTTKQGTPLHVMLSYQVISASTIFFLTYLGWTGWMYDPPLEDRIRGYSPTADTMARTMATYQVWNVLMCLYIAEYRTIPSLLHHVGAILVPVLGMEPCLHAYTYFYLGISETSTLPLYIMDTAKYVPVPEPVVYASKIAFVVLFMLFRVVIWSGVNLMLWYDIFRANAFHGTPRILVMLQIALTILQYYWAYQIVQEVKKDRRRV